MHEALGQMFLDGIRIFCAAHAISLQSLNLIGVYAGILKHLPSHVTGVTNPICPIWHKIVTAATGVTTVSDFTVTELGWPGPYLPPMTFVHSIMFRHAAQTHAFLSIDEVASLTIIPALTNEGARLATAHNCGPGTMLIDYARRYYALDKSHEDRPATQGKANQSIVDQFLRAHSICQVAPDINMSFELFGDHEAQRLIDDCSALDMTEMDTLATIEYATTQNIVRQYHKSLQNHSCANHYIDKLYIHSAGATSPTLSDRLKQELSRSVSVILLNENGSSIIEMYSAFCYAHLALEATFTPAVPYSARLTHGLTQKKAFITGENIVWGNSWN
jgi:1,6-anhydro-N-acetylmuramate kinase